MFCWILSQIYISHHGFIVFLEVFSLPFKNHPCFFIYQPFLKMRHSPNKADYLTIYQLIKIDESSINWSWENESIFTKLSKTSEHLLLIWKTCLLIMFINKFEVVFFPKSEKMLFIFFIYMNFLYFFFTRQFFLFHIFPISLFLRHLPLFGS